MTSAQAQRAQAAVKAMKLIGFDQGVAKAVLKKLLKVYENNWEYIEAENYRLLADSILDNQESKDPDVNEKDVAVSHEPSPKRLRRKQEDPGPSQLAIQPIFGSSSIQDKLFDEVCNDVSENYDVPLLVQPSHVISTAEEDEAYKGGIYVANASPGSTYNPNMQRIPNSRNGVESLQVSAHKEVMTELASAQEKFSNNVDIASSNMGEVKLSLTYSSGCQDFKMPSLESIFKMFEDRCLKSYKILQPNFSAVNLMKEMCQCAADLAAESGKDPKEDIVKVTPLLESSKRSRLSGVYHGMTRRSSPRLVNPVTFETPMTIMNGFESSQNIDSGSNDIQGNSLLESSCLSPSRTLAIIPSHEHACIVSMPRHDENDIAKWEERVRISVINEFTSEKLPPWFHYIPQNVIYQNAHVNFSLARIGDEDCCVNCFGDCLSAPIQCACTRETGGEFVYTLDGLLNKEFLCECISMNHDPDKHHHVYCKKDCPIEMSKNEQTPDTCKGHLVRKFIKECWSKCGCNKQCGNRVVQRGITRKLQVFYTGSVKGWGLRTLEELPRGAFVCEYVGEILTNIELYNRTVGRIGSAKHTYPVLLDADWGSEAGLRDEEALCLDATFYGNVGRFVNHRCVDATLVEVPVEWETPDHHYYHLAFFTTRKLEALEELTWDYGIDFDDRTHPIKAFKCLCGSRFCRDGRRRSKTRSRASSCK